MTTDPKLVEAVARALFAFDNDPILWCDHTDETRANYRGAAECIIPLIRKATLEETIREAKSLQDIYYADQHIDMANACNSVVEVLKALLPTPPQKQEGE